ncbi:MAG: cupin domain-containing protein [Actinomycetota bacterium]|nr:cupin domain-containing protein [Actinomycetota bacterium]
MTTTEPTTERTTPEVTAYSMKVPLLTSGRTNQVLARTDTVEVRAKVYAEGGENALHTHLDEDHTFFVLDGEATFYGPDDQTLVVGRYEGLMIPAGAYYRFQSTGDTNLVLLRFGADVEAPEGAVAPRVGPDGLPLEGKDPRNKQQPPVFSGATFGEG